LAIKGLFVFTACSHAGLINVLTHAASGFPASPCLACWAASTSLVRPRRSFRRPSTR
jgi:hypothetical protein